MQHYNHRYLQGWLVDCLSCKDVEVTAVCNLKDNVGREVWDATIEIRSKRRNVVISVFKPCSLDCVNTSLPPDQTAMKCALALTELPTLGIPTPLLLGYATHGDTATIVCEKIFPVPFQ